jgi:hypothetical protein
MSPMSARGFPDPTHALLLPWSRNGPPRRPRCPCPHHASFRPRGPHAQETKGGYAQRHLRTCISRPASALCFSQTTVRLVFLQDLVVLALFVPEVRVSGRRRGKTEWRYVVVYARQPRTCRRAASLHLLVMRDNFFLARFLSCPRCAYPASPEAGRPCTV